MIQKNALTPTPLIMANQLAESAWDNNHYGQFVHTFIRHKICEDIRKTE